MNCEQKDLHVLQWDMHGRALSVWPVAEMLAANQKSMLKGAGQANLPVMLGSREVCERMLANRAAERMA